VRGCPEKWFFQKHLAVYKGVSTMSTEENKAIVRRYVEECWNKKSLSTLDELFAPNCLHYMNGRLNHQGPEDYKNALEAWFKAFPDIQHTIEDEVAEDDKVVIRLRASSTHNGEMQFPGMPSAIPPTGKNVEIVSMSMSRIADGMIVEQWDIADFRWMQHLAKNR
jgi:predicted ester cyclase